MGWTTTPSSCSPPTTGPRISPGRTADRHPSPAARVPVLKVPPGKVENGIVSGLDWFPTLVAAAGDPNVVSELLTGKKVGDQTFKVHLDGYNQLDLITGKAPSARHEIFSLT